ncbi:OLC1v1024973C2 [Oldenlandia corymbosa var. corymbosa]|uniref:OLC1v1024973C2 n=1 Tax=Oldenlandia corymbosa var. corymbosa TaxID=529605 RepID=A0AAV1C709_OLDCO|nr:OLC1v1024973C2 [Oldenlandia corymbosa var. corymbosa]
MDPPAIADRRDDDIELGGVSVEMAESAIGSSTAAANELSSSSSSPSVDGGDSVSDQITPLLSQSQRQKVNIFSLPYPRRRPVKEQVTKLAETEISPFMQFALWVWNGSRYSGLLCMVVSSVIYCLMEIVSDVFTAQSIPLFEMAFTRCTIILVLSFVWLKRSRQPIFSTTSSVRKLLVLRAVMGYLSLLSFVYSIQRVPPSQSIILSFTTPIMAAIAARFILHEKLKIAEIGGLACSFFGVLFVFRPIINLPGPIEAGDANALYATGSSHILAVLVGLFSSTIGGISYCLTRAGAKAADQPVLTVFAFGLIASPAAAISSLTFEDLVFPRFYSLLLMIVLGVSAFLAEVTLARGLQLEKTGKAVNILYVEAALQQLLGMSTSRIAPTFGRLVGCLLIFISACCTMYIGPEKEIE